MTAQTPGTQDGAKLADLLEDCWKLTFDGPIVRVENTALRKRIDEQLAALRHPPAAELTGGGGGAGMDTTKVSDEYYPPAAVAQGTREEPMAWINEHDLWRLQESKDAVVTARATPAKDDVPLYAAPPRGTLEQTAWLIEMPAARWGTGYCWGGPEVWTSIEHAIRFARKEDAEAVIETLKVYNRKCVLSIEYEACEHLWIDAGAGRR